MLCGITMTTDHRPFDLSLSSDLNPPLVRSFALLPTCTSTLYLYQPCAAPACSSFPTRSFDSPVFAGSRCPSITISRRMMGSIDNAVHGGEGSILLMVAPSDSRRAVFSSSASRRRCPRRRRDCSLPSCCRQVVYVHYRSSIQRQPRTNRRDESVDTWHAEILTERDGGAILAHTYRRKATWWRFERRKLLPAGLTADSGSDREGYTKGGEAPTPAPRKRKSGSLSYSFVCVLTVPTHVSRDPFVNWAHARFCVFFFFFTKLVINFILNIYIFFQNHALSTSRIFRIWLKLIKLKEWK